MIDIHCHMLPGIDDGAPDLDTALRMAEMAVADGITMTLCTPHIYPGVFDNTVPVIQSALESFQRELDTLGIPLDLGYGADIQVGPDLADGLKSGELPTLHGGCYFLFEPPHHSRLPRLADIAHEALLHGFVPVITHPERLSYIDEDYDLFVQAARAGAWIQLTGGSLLGKFGSRAQHAAERFLRDGITHVLASDGHNLQGREPVLSEARDAAAAIVGEREAIRLVKARPLVIVRNAEPDVVPLPAALRTDAPRPRSRRQRPGRRLVRWFQSLIR